MVDRSGLEALLKLLDQPYQPYGDSPTIKSYTDWSLYDKYLRLVAENPWEAGEAETRIEGAAVEEDARPLGLMRGREKLADIHYALADRAYLLRLRGGEAVAEARPRITVSAHHLAAYIEGDGNGLRHTVRGGEHYLSAMLEARLGDGASLDLFIDLRGGRGPLYYAAAVVLGDGAELNIAYLARPGGMTRATILVYGAGRGARIYARGVAVAGGKERLDNVADIVLGGPGSTAYFSFTGAQTGESVVAQRGVGKTLAGSDGASIEYYSESLLLSNEARFYAQPRLEIEHGLVEAARHAARSLQTLPSQLFYLETRGLGEDEARYLVTRGFLVQGLRGRYREAIAGAIDEYLGELGLRPWPRR